MHQNANWCRGFPRLGPHCARCGPSLPQERAQHPLPRFGPSIVAKWSPVSATVDRSLSTFSYIILGDLELFSWCYQVLSLRPLCCFSYLISVQPPCSTRSSSLVTLARPPTSSTLCITDRFFQYVSPCLWNQLPSSLRQPHLSPSVSDFPVHAPTIPSLLTLLTQHSHHP